MVTNGKRAPRVLLGATHSAIENLGLIYLLGVARDEGWDRGISLVKNHDFKPFFDRVQDFKPDVVGFNIYTGCHLQLFEAFDRLRIDHPNTRLVIGGPHATYFPEEAIKHADNVVMSEGFRAFREILRDEVGSGIIEFSDHRMEPFPEDDRDTFYRDSPEHAKSPIKSTISMTGCVYRCDYCYNSTKKDVIQVAEGLKARRAGISLPISGQEELHDNNNTRLFPTNVRDIAPYIAEGKRVAEKWPETKIFYDQADIWGFTVNKFKQDGTFQSGSLEEMSEGWMQQVGIPLHAQMRWEMTEHDAGSRRLDLAKKIGVTGLTLAIEAADPIIRKEVVNRNMEERIMVEGMRKLVEREMTVRTEQITGLPSGATSQPTKINLDADLELVELNVRLREQTGGPTMAWASTLAPYKRTNIGFYAHILGFYRNDNSDVPDEFFERSVLRFLKEWIGDRLEVKAFQAQWATRKGLQNIGEINLPDSVWLPPNEQEDYKDKNAELRRHFNTFAILPKGHVVAAQYLRDKSRFGYQYLGEVIETHLKTLAERGDPRATEMLSRIPRLRSSDFGLNGAPQDQQMKAELRALAPYLAALPQPEQTAARAISYARDRSSNGQFNGEALSPRVISTAVRHQLYDGSLYRVEGNNERKEDKERYAVKV